MDRWWRLHWPEVIVLATSGLVGLALALLMSWWGLLVSLPLGILVGCLTGGWIYDRKEAIRQREGWE